MSKSDYRIKLVSQKQCRGLLKSFHYITRKTGNFKSGVNCGLYLGDALVGVCIFTGFPVPELVKGCFGLDRTEQEGFWELSRLVLDPVVQNYEHNLASWFISKAIKTLRRNEKVRAVLSYADCEHHQGIVYAASNFSYYGLTTPKKDFWIKQKDGTFVKHQRGKTKGVDGEWRPRSQKQRFLIVYDKSLEVKWTLQKWSRAK